MNSKTAIITGADGGLGRDMARHLSEQGWSLILVDRTPSIHELPATLGCPAANAITRCCDLANRTALEGLCAEITSGALACGALINNAGVSSYGPDGQALGLETIDRDSLEHVLSINLVAPFMLSQAVIPAFRARGWGRLVHIASRGGRTFSEVFPANFSASKAGLIALSRSIAGEFGQYGVTSNVIAPGVIETPQTAKVDPALLRHARIPAGRFGQPNEISAAVAYLLSDNAAFTNGAVIDINGGAFMPS